MSVHHRIPDVLLQGAEGPTMTQLGPSTSSRVQPKGDVRRDGLDQIIRATEWIGAWHPIGRAGRVR